MHCLGFHEKQSVITQESRDEKSGADLEGMRVRVVFQMPITRLAWTVRCNRERGIYAQVLAKEKRGLGILCRDVRGRRNICDKGEEDKKIYGWVDR